MAQAQGYARPRPKIETLVDLIFGLSLSIGAVALITVSAPSSTAEINRRLLAFIFTASFLITNWMVYTYQMSVLPVETNFVIYMNVVMLILVATVPYLLYNVEFANPSLTPQEYSVIQDYASSLFAVDLAAILAILASFSHIILDRRKKAGCSGISKEFSAEQECLSDSLCDRTDLSSPHLLGSINIRRPTTAIHLGNSNHRLLD